jgi:hypothetical protein
MIKHIYVFVVAVLTIGCSHDAPKKENEKDLALSVLDSAIAFYSEVDLKKMSIAFDFRGKTYAASWPSEGMIYTNFYTDSLGAHKRQLQNGKYQEWLNDRELQLDDKTRAARGSSVNSVLYFALLPWNLQDEAVRATYVGESTIDSRLYHNIKVTFSEAGGGDDYDDVFLYWFDADDYSMDYLAYSYREDEGGTRFRSASNARRVNGIMFQDYANYKGPADSDSLSFILDMYNEGKLDLLSQIDLSKIQVQLAE